MHIFSLVYSNYGKGFGVVMCEITQIDTLLVCETLKTPMIMYIIHKMSMVKFQKTFQHIVLAIMLLNWIIFTVPSSQSNENQSCLSVSGKERKGA